MKKENDKKIEDFLKIFSLKTAPPGLKEKILHSALHEKQSSAALTPFLWKGFAATLILLIIVIAVDVMVSNTQNNRLSSFLDSTQESSDRHEEEWSMLKDIIWETQDSTGNAEKKKFYDLREDSEINRRQIEWREIFEKEFEYHESTKNLP